MAQRAATASFMVKMILGDINQKSMLMRSGNAMAARSEKGRLPHSSPRRFGFKNVGRVRRSWYTENACIFLVGCSEKSGRRPKNEEWLLNPELH